jgi:hypothetical protein
MSILEIAAFITVFAIGYLCGAARLRKKAARLQKSKTGPEHQITDYAAFTGGDLPSLWTAGGSYCDFSSRAFSFVTSRA